MAARRVIGRMGRTPASSRTPSATTGLYCWLLVAFLDLVEHTAVSEMGFLSLLPTAENVIDGDKFEFRELLLVLFGDSLISGAIEIFRRDFLSDVRIEVFKVGLRDRLVPLPASHFLHQCHWR